MLCPFVVCCVGCCVVSCGLRWLFASGCIGCDIAFCVILQQSGDVKMSLEAPHSPGPEAFTSLHSTLPFHPFVIECV